MKNDIVELIADRFRLIDNICIVVDNTYDEHCITVRGIGKIYFDVDSIAIYVRGTVLRVHYNDFHDVDLLVGDMLYMRFYERPH